MNECAELFADFITSKNLTFDSSVDNDGDSLVNFPYDGRIARCYFSGDDGRYLTIYYYLENTPEEKIPDVLYLCNELNAQYKWVKFYLDSDNDVVLQTDALLTPMSAADVAFEILARLLDIYKEAKPTIMKTIYG